MTAQPSHAVLTVAVADHETDEPAWRLQHAADTIRIVLAYFATDTSGLPVRAADGTYDVHAPSQNTLATLRQMLTRHEGFTIVRERQEPGLGVLREDQTR
ncbi:hypothetical protein [Streptosporangium jomthongense]|uniref:Uncharacterized protein n=1 Tax=Streptosporangium jomthongense TaxID=1193683 RepID=A0ABV8FEX6_9ACTN